MVYFTIKELCKSQRAELLGIKNIPNDEEEFALLRLIEEVLNPIRIEYGSPITVSSGFRCEELNKKTKGASKSSQHRKGQAADLFVRDLDGLKKIFTIAINQNKFDQLIWEEDSKGNKWIHISYNNKRKKQRGQILKFKNGSYVDITKYWKTQIK